VSDGNNVKLNYKDDLIGINEEYAKGLKFKKTRHLLTNWPDKKNVV
jgi:hypothetical protein